MSAVGTLGHFIAINKFGPSFIITIGIITEWLPKLLFYLVSGRITNRLGFKSTILITEFVKTITSLLIALLSSLLIVSDEYRLNIFYYLMISTNLAIYQMASALTNVAFETEVYYEEKEQSYKKVLSYAGLMRSEIVPSILFVPIIVFIAKDPIFIFYIGFLAHLSAFFYSKFTFMQIERAKVYSNLMDFRLDIIDGIKCIFKTIQIRILAILGVITTTYALTFSKISQTIFHFDNVLISQKMYVYSRSFSLAFVFFWSIYFSKKLLIKNNIESIIIKIHVIIIFTFLALLTVYQSYFNKSSFIFLVLCGLLLSVSEKDRKSTRLNSSHYQPSRMPSSA